jgi:hypothetical protein
MLRKELTRQGLSIFSTEAKVQDIPIKMVMTHRETGRF